MPKVGERRSRICSFGEREVRGFALIGIGAVVTKDVSPGDVVAGNPADRMDRAKAMARIRARLIEEAEERGT